MFNAVLVEGDKLYSPERRRERKEIFAHSQPKRQTAGMSLTGSNVLDAPGAMFQRSTLTKKAYEVTVIAKLAMISILKFSALDPQGMSSPFLSLPLSVSLSLFPTAD